MGTELQKWLDDADIPEFVPGQGWVDLETGIPFRPAEYRRSPAGPASATVKAARKMASTKGWAPLRGSTKQKRWAAEIRAGLIPRLPAVLQEVAGNLADSGFWIDHRNEQPEKFHDLIRRCSH